jgi:hypothetical protein
MRVTSGKNKESQNADNLHAIGNRVELIQGAGSLSFRSWQSGGPSALNSVRSRHSLPRTSTARALGLARNDDYAGAPSGIATITGSPSHGFFHTAACGASADR